MKRFLPFSFKSLTLLIALNFLVSCDSEVNKIDVNNQFAIQLFTDTVRMSDLLTMVDSTTLEYFKIDEYGEISLFFSDTINDAISSEDVLSGMTKFDFIDTKEISVNFPNLSGNLEIIEPELSFKYINTFDFEATGVIDSVFFTNASGNKISLLENWTTIERPLPPTGNTSAELTNIDDYVVDNFNLLDDYRKVTFNGNINFDADDVDYNTIAEDSHLDFITEISLPLEFVIENLIFNNIYDFSIEADDDENSEGINLDGDFDEIEFKFVCVNTLPIQVKPQIYIVQDNTVVDSLFVEDSYIHAGSAENPTEDVIIVKVVDDKLQKIREADQVMLNVGLTSLGNNVVLNADDYFFLRVGMTTKTSEIYVD